MKKISMTAAGIFFLTLMVKAAGVFREGFIADTFGASSSTDRYLFIFSLVTLIVLVFGTSFNHLFLPYYQTQQQKAARQAEQESVQLLNTLFLGSAIAALIIGTGTLIALYAGIDRATVSLIGTFSLGLPFLLLNAFLDTFLQVRSRYYLSAAVKLFPIAGSLLAAAVLHQGLGLVSLAIGFVAGSILACLFQGILLKRTGLQLSKKLVPLNQYSTASWFIAGQTLISVLAGPVNVVIDRFFAGFLPAGSLTYLNNASLVTSLPIGLIGSTLEILYFSAITEKLTKRTDLTAVVRKGLSTSQLVFLPIMIGLYFTGSQIIRLIYQHGAFHANDTAHTTMILLGYLPLIWFQGIQLVLSKTVYAVKAGSRLFRLSLWMVGCNTLLDALFFPIWGAPGLAAASSVVAFIYLLGTMRLLQSTFTTTWSALLQATILPTIVPSLLMMGTGLWLRYGIHFDATRHLVVAFILFVIICAAVYFAALLFFSSAYLHRLFGSEKD